MNILLILGLIVAVGYAIFWGLPVVAIFVIANWMIIGSVIGTYLAIGLIYSIMNYRKEIRKKFDDALVYSGMTREEYVLSTRFERDRPKLERDVWSIVYDISLWPVEVIWNIIQLKWLSEIVKKPFRWIYEAVINSVWK